MALGRIPQTRFDLCMPAGDPCPTKQHCSSLKLVFSRVPEENGIGGGPEKYWGLRGFLLDPPVGGTPIFLFMVRFIVTLIIAAIAAAPMALGHDPGGHRAGFVHAHGDGHHAAHHAADSLAGHEEHDCDHGDRGQETAPCESRTSHCTSAFLSGDFLVRCHVPLDGRMSFLAFDTLPKTLGPEADTPPPRS